jgi:hypothetical protein
MWIALWISLWIRTFPGECSIATGETWSWWSNQNSQRCESDLLRSKAQLRNLKIIGLFTDVNVD